MLSWFTDDSTFPVLTGFGLFLCLSALALYGREKRIFYGALVVAGLSLLTLVTEVLIVTDKEKVTNTLYEIEKSVRENDFEKTFSFIENDKTIEFARSHVDKLVVDQCNIIGFNGIEINHDAIPKTAEADFSVFADVQVQGSAYRGPLKMLLEMTQQPDDSWKMVHYQVSIPPDRLVRTSKE